MNTVTLPVRANERPLYSGSLSQTASYPTETKIVSTLALLLLGYYVLSFFDAWPSTFKRGIYELGIYLTPSPLIYAMQYGMIRLGRLSLEEGTFTRAKFGDVAAKQEAMRKILGQPQMSFALRRVRSLSGSYISVGNRTGPPGLGNWDNSCYQNSVLQGLASLPAFIGFMEQSLRLCDKYDTPASTHRALVVLLEQLADSNSPTSMLWTPQILKSMDSWTQQDAQEYFSRILDAIEKEAGRCVQKMKQQTLATGLECLNTTGGHHDAQAVGEDKWQAAEMSETVKIQARPLPNLLQGQQRSPIDGMTAQCLECKTCGFSEGLSLTQFNCLTLNLGLRGSCDVEELLNEYTTPEDVDGVECENCAKLAHGEVDRDERPDDKEEDSNRPPEQKKPPVLRTKSKQITVGRLPKDLVLHINRSIFDNYGSQLKNTAPVRVPSRLKFLRRWCAPLDAADDSIEAIYALRCVVTHYGRHDDGHYVALGRRDKDWYSFNDETVTKITEEEVLNRQNGFMVFYEAISSSTPTFETTPATTATEESAKVPPKVRDVPLTGLDEALDTDATVDGSSPTGNSSSMSTSEPSTPVEASMEEELPQSEIAFPPMRTAGDVASHPQQPPSGGVAAVSVL